MDVRTDVQNVEKLIEQLEKEYERSREESSQLFDVLTNRSTTLELVKARCGMTTGSLAAMLEQAEQQNDSTLEEQDFELLRGQLPCNHVVILSAASLRYLQGLLCFTKNSAANV